MIERKIEMYSSYEADFGEIAFDYSITATSDIVNKNGVISYPIFVELNNAHTDVTLSTSDGSVEVTISFDTLREAHRFVTIFTDDVVPPDFDAFCLDQEQWCTQFIRATYTDGLHMALATRMIEANDDEFVEDTDEQPDDEEGSI